MEYYSAVKNEILPFVTTWYYGNPLVLHDAQQSLIPSFARQYCANPTGRAAGWALGTQA